jgi:hypothetical protein
MAGPYSKRMREELGEAVLKGAATRQEVYVLVDQFIEKFDAIEAELQQLKANGAKFRGVFQRAINYQRGDQTTHKGSLWVALGDVPEGTVPGESPTHWQLAAKGIG